MERIAVRPNVDAKVHATVPAQYHPDTLPAIFNEAELRAQPPAQPRVLRDTWLPDSCIMAARTKAESSAGLYLACIAADNGKSHSHNDTGSFWVYSEGLPVLMDMGQETYQKNSLDAHRKTRLPQQCSRDQRQLLLGALKSTASN